MRSLVNSRSYTLWILIVLMFLLGIGAVISGAMLFLAPDGSAMQMSVDALSNSPFTDFLIPGIILFIFVGIFPLFTGFGLLKQPTWNSINKINPFKSLHWAWTASLASGLILLIWIATETILLGYISFLQPVMGGWGVLIVLFTMLPGVKWYYRRIN